MKSAYRKKSRPGRGFRVPLAVWLIASLHARTHVVPKMRTCNLTGGLLGKTDGTRSSLSERDFFPSLPAGMLNIYAAVERKVGWRRLYIILLRCYFRQPWRCDGCALVEVLNILLELQRIRVCDSIMQRSVKYEIRVLGEKCSLTLQLVLFSCKWNSYSKQLMTSKRKTQIKWYSSRSYKSFVFGTCVKSNKRRVNWRSFLC